jgi:hypothetical protein
LRITLPDGRTLVGDEALAFGGSDAQIDPNTGQMISPAISNGLQALLRVLTSAYGADADQTAVSTLDKFFSLRRNRSSLLEYLNEHDYLYGEAVAIGGLGLNDVGKSHFLLKHAGLPKDKQDHILLLVNQDLRRYNDIKTHLERMAKTAEPIHDGAHFADYDTWLAWRDYDYNDMPSDVAELFYNGWFDHFEDDYDLWPEYDDDYGYHAWYDDEWQQQSNWQDDHSTWQAAIMPSTLVGNDHTLAELDINVLYGKGRRMKGKGKGKGYRRFGKGKGKGKGYFPYRRFGKGGKCQGKGKGKP